MEKSSFHEQPVVTPIYEKQLADVHSRMEELRRELTITELKLVLEALNNLGDVTTSQEQVKIRKDIDDIKKNLENLESQESWLQVLKALQDLSSQKGNVEKNLSQSHSRFAKPVPEELKPEAEEQKSNVPINGEGVLSQVVEREMREVTGEILAHMNSEVETLEPSLFTEKPPPYSNSC